MTDLRRALCTLLAIAAVAPLPAGAGPQRDAEDQRPSLSLRATPPVGFAPLRVRLSVDVRGGADDHADFYCPSIEWEWGDGTSSQSSSDCEPYVAGKSTIQRRWSAEHVFPQEGGYRVVFRIKQKTRQIAAANATVQVRSGLRGEGE